MKPTVTLENRTIRVLSVTKHAKSWQKSNYHRTGAKDRVSVNEVGNIIHGACFKGVSWGNTPDEQAGWRKAFRNEHAFQRPFVQELLDSQGRGDVKFAYVEGDIQAFVLDEGSEYGYTIEITALTDEELEAHYAAIDDRTEQNRRATRQRRIDEARIVLMLAESDVREAELWDGKGSYEKRIKLEWETRSLVYNLQKQMEDEAKVGNIILTEVAS